MWYVMQVSTGTEEEICQQCRRRVKEADEDVFILTVERMTKVHDGRFRGNGSWLAEDCFQVMCL